MNDGIGTSSSRYCSKIEHISQLLMLTMSQCQRRHAATLITRTVGPVPIYKTDCTNLIYGGLDVVQNQYQDLF